MTASGNASRTHIISPPLSAAAGLTFTGRGPPRHPAALPSS
jgi:hypothetical protein